MEHDQLPRGGHCPRPDGENHCREERVSVAGLSGDVRPHQLSGSYPPSTQHAPAEVVDGYGCSYTSSRARAFIVSRRTVSFSMRSRRTSKPIPGVCGSTISPALLTVTSGSMMSSDQYRFEADTSPGNVKFGSDDNAILCARPMPVSSIPPHHT